METSSSTEVPAATADQPQESFFNSLDMRVDRSAGWQVILDRGPLFQADGMWYITDAALIREVERRTDAFSTARAFDFMASPVPLIPLAIDPPDHARYRRVLDPFFSPREINKIEPQLRVFLNELIDDFIDDGICDVMATLATPFPSQVFMTLFGFPIEELDTFLDLSRRIMHGLGFGSSEDVAKAGTDLADYLKVVIAEKRRRPSDDLLSKILALAGEDEWTQDEIIGMCQLFVTAGLDTVRSSIGFTFRHLAEDAQLRSMMRSYPGFVDLVLQEVLRIEPPAPLNPRVAVKDVVLGGAYEIPAGAYCVMAFGAANRSAEYGDDANQSKIRLEWGHKPNLTFGAGIHRCIGVHLARRELSLVLEEFHKRIPVYRLAEGHEPKIVWPSLNFLYEELHLEFPVAAR